MTRGIEGPQEGEAVGEKQLDSRSRDRVTKKVHTEDGICLVFISALPM